MPTTTHPPTNPGSRSLGNTPVPPSDRGPGPHIPIIVERPPIVLGIDPGAKGALSVMTLRGEVLDVWDWPGGASELWELVANESLFNPVLVCMEAQHGFFMSRGNVENGGRSATINFGLGTNYGIWLGMAAVLGWPLELVSTATWRRRVLDSTVPKKPVKADLVAFARRRWPHAEIAGPRGGAKDGRAEAVCIAEYARQQTVGGKS